MDNSYNVDKNGRITDKGKFERETLDVPHFYEVMLEGGENNDGLIEIDESEHEYWEIPTDVHYVRVDESERGFVTLRYFTEAQLPEWQKEYWAGFDVDEPCQLGDWEEED